MFLLSGLALALAAVSGPSGDPPAPVRGEAVVRAQHAPGGDIRQDLAQTEAMHRAAVRGPIEQWWLEPIKARYQALLPRAGDSATEGLIRARLATVERQEALVREARAVDETLRRSRLRDAGVASIRRRLASVKGSERSTFDAEGVIQPSARKIDGEKAMALIGPDGFAVAYLRMPPGVDSRSLLTKRVGVRGAVHYDEHLRARVIAVSDVEPLERPR